MNDVEEKNTVFRIEVTKEGEKPYSCKVTMITPDPPNPALVEQAFKKLHYEYVRREKSAP